MKKISIILLFCFFSLGLLAQQQITGVVRDEKGKVLSGVTLRNLATSIQTQTNDKGSFRLAASSGQIIEASSIGYESARMTYEGQSTFEMILKETFSSLDETVVIGYQAVSRKKSTAAISSISGKELEDLPAASFDMLLQGRLAGVNVQNFSGAPGAAPSLSVRGNASVSTQYQGNDFYNVISSPLYVIDGVPQPTEQFVGPNTGTGTNYLAGLNPRDIESIDVLRDASAAAIYGSRAANGVIMITTKKGRSGEPRVEVTGWSGITQRPELRNVTLGRNERNQKMQIFRERLTLAEQRFLPILLTDSLNPAFNGNTDWQDLFYQKGRINNADLALSGGSDLSSYRFSSNLYDEDGIITATGFKRYSGRLNLTTRAMQQRLVINPIVSYAYNKRLRGSGSDSNPIPLGAGNMPSSLFNMSDARRDFYLGTFDSNLDNNENASLNTNLNLTYTILPGFTFTSQSSYINNRASRAFSRPSILTSGAGNSATAYTQEDNQLRTSNYFNYNTVLGKHNLSAVMGFEAEKNRLQSMYSAGYFGVSDQIQVVRGFLQNNIRTETDLQRWTQLSTLGRLTYDYDGKYLFSGTFRSDGSSRFGENNKWGIFPSASVGWIISEEGFMENARDYVSLLKLRGSFGSTGSLPRANYLQYNLYNVNNGGFWGNDAATSYNGQPVIMPNFYDGVAQRNLSWERNRQWNVGFDVEVLDGRFTAMIDVFNKENYDGLFPVELPITSGYTIAQTNSVGVRNSGIDIQLGADLFPITSEFKWRSNLNISYVRNRIMNLPNNNRDLIVGGAESRFDKTHILSVGSPINAFYLYRTLGVFSTMDDIPINPYTGERFRNSNGEYQPGNFHFDDLDGDYFVDVFNDGINPDKIPFGDPHFKWVGGWNNVFSYKDFSATFFFTYGFDRDVLNLFEADRFGNSTSGDAFNNFAYYSIPDLDQVNMWRQPGDQADYAGYDLGSYRYYYTAAQTFFMERGSYIRFKNLILSYNLPERVVNKVGLSKLRVFGIMDNIAMWQQSKRLPDAEAVNPYGEYNGAGYPIPRKYTMGVELTF